MALDEFGREIPGLSSIPSNGNTNLDATMDVHAIDARMSLIDDDRHRVIDLNLNVNANIVNANVNDRERDLILSNEQGGASAAGADRASYKRFKRHSSRSRSRSHGRGRSRSHSRSRSRSRSYSPSAGMGAGAGAGIGSHQWRRSKDYESTHTATSRDLDRDRDRHYRDRDNNRDRESSGSGGHGYHHRHGHGGHSHTAQHGYYHHRRDSRDNNTRYSSRDRDKYRDRDRDKDKGSYYKDSRTDSYTYRRGTKSEYSHSYNQYRDARASSSVRRRKTPASEKYVHSPLLCQHLWQLEHNQTPMELMQPETETETEQRIQLEPTTELELQQQTSVTMDTSLGTLDNTNNNANVNVIQTTNTGKEQEREREQQYNQSISKESYDDYVKRYCLNYIRTFFNYHLDDQWFRQRYSPLEYKRFIEKERSRASKEAHIINREITLSNNNISQSSSTSPFIVNARLGGGVKPSATMASYNSNYDHHHHHHHPLSSTPGSTLSTAQSSRKRKYNSVSEAPATSIIDPSIPQSHLLSFVKENRCLHIMDIPPYVSDQQLLLTLKDHCDEASSTNQYPIEIYSSAAVDTPCSVIASTANADNNIHTLATGITGSQTIRNAKEMLYYRNAWAIFESEAAKVCTLSHLLVYFFLYFVLFYNNI